MAKLKRELLVAISAGGDDHELAANGIGMEHVEELMVRLAMRFLSNGHRLAFGGTLGDANKNLTKYLIETAQRWADNDDDKVFANRVNITRPDTWPLVNYSSEPAQPPIDDEQKAKLVGICNFVSIPSRLNATIDKSTFIVPAQKKRLAADALTVMRNYSAKHVDFRIVWSGKIMRSTGWMAGILEEVVCTLELQKPLLVLGGFGGCARLIAEFLQKKSAKWPKDLSLEACADADRDALLTAAERDALNQRITHAREVLTTYRTAIHNKAITKVHGVSSILIKRAFTEESTRVAINIASEAAERL